MTRPIHVLFLCTHNSARSILAEAALRHRGGGRVAAFSAGSEGGGGVNPLALSTLEDAGIAVSGLASKSWDVFAGEGAPVMDYIITVCDSAAGEACPFWPGHPTSAHWGLEDPSRAPGDEAARRAAFARTLGLIAARIDAFLALPLENAERGEILAAMKRIGAMDGATALARAP